MKSKVISIFIISAAILFWGIGYEAPVAAQGDVVVIVNKSQASLSRTQIKRIFTGTMKSFPGGSPVKVLLNSNSSIYAGFCSKYMGSSPAGVDGKWKAVQMRNGTPLPRKVSSNVIKAMVGGSPLFIGFVNRSEAGGNVKILD